jgi:hypothetical protein
MTSKIAVTLLAALLLALPVNGQTPLPLAPRSLVESTANTQEEAIGPAALANQTGAGNTYWGSADYLVGWVRGARLPPLVTTTLFADPKASAGVLPNFNTKILFGDEQVNGEARSGFRLGLGGWLTEDHAIGVDVGFFMTESQATLFAANTTDFPILARPFIDVSKTKPLPTALLIGFPGESTGSTNVAANSGQFYGTHLDFQEALFEGPRFRLKSLLGYRFLRFDDGLEIQQTAFPTSGGFFPGTQQDIRDLFVAQNEFHGCEIGFQSDFLRERWSLSFLSKVAVGNLHRDVRISGVTTTTVPGSAPVTTNSGLFALSSNRGTHSSNDWVGAPEIGVNFGYAVTSNVQVRLGYSLLYLYDVARAADQVDLSINPKLIPPITGAAPQSPAFNLERSNLWLQSINVGMELRY